MKLSIKSQEPIYPGEQLDMGHFQIYVRRENNDAFWKGVVVDMILFYSGGRSDTAYIPSAEKFFSDRKEIEELLAKMNYNFEI